MTGLKRDISDLPPGDDRTGLLPDAEPRFVQVLVDQWHEAREDDKPTALGTRFRHSDAGKCARVLSYKALGFAQTDPMDRTGTWNTEIGTTLHGRWQAALLEKYPDAEVEVKVRTADDVDGSGHIDAVIKLDGKTICYELKTVGGYAFKSAVGKQRRGTPAEGPKAGHILQVSLAASALGADEAVIGYLAKEAISVNIGKGMSDLDRIHAEWTFTPDQFEPLAAEERKRIAGILALADDGLLAARKVPHEMPRGAEITDPSRGLWQQVDADGQIVDTGKFWGCAYCSHQSLCATTEPGRIKADDVKGERS